MDASRYSIRKEKGVWWLRSPSGRRMFYPSVQCVAPRHGSKVPGAPTYDGLKACGGDLGKWISRTQKRLAHWGFKGLGAWNDSLWHRAGIPFTESLNVWKSLYDKRGLKAIWDADWEKRAEEHIAPQVARLRRHPNLVGWFLDNEIPWDPGVLFSYFERPAGDPNRAAVLSFLKERYRTVGALNRAWGTKVASWGALAKAKCLPASRDAAQGDMEAFITRVSRRFFEITCRLVRKHDPGRLILGVRYAGLPLPAVVKGQKGHTDVVSMNLYIQEGVFPEAEVYEAHRLTGQPAWVTEFSWHAPFDNRSGARNNIGFGSRVRWQESRARGYSRFVGHMASLPFMIGCDWFQWPDESPMGRGDGEDVDFGVVDLKDRPYEKLVAAMRRTNLAVDRLHAASGRWRFVPRPSPEPPATSVARLERRPAPGARGRGVPGSPLGGLRFRPSLDPMPPRVPVRARLGWRPEGLWASVEVADAKRHIDIRKTMRSIEWFWTTDAVELFVRAGEEAPAFFDARSFKVWAIPEALAGGKRPFVGALRAHRKTFGGSTGVRVGQRKLPGGYRLDFWMPARLFGSGTLRPWQVLRFDMLVEDCEKVQEVYWSAHGGEWTMARPAKWGRLVLVP